MFRPFSNPPKIKQYSSHMRKPTLSRRDFVKGATAGWIFLQSGAAFSLNNILTDKSPPHKKFVWVFLRGALDALHTVVPTSDPNLMGHRGDLLATIHQDLLPLDNDYALHPSLRFMHQLYTNKQMSPVVAVASGYRERSHFDAQDQMESGLNNTNHENGWLARLSQQIQGNSIAISRSVPIALRGEQSRADTWYPSGFAEASDDFINRLSSMYENDPILGTHLEALIAQKENPNMQMQTKKRADFAYLATRCGELLESNDNMQCAMLEMGGWDTHNNQNNRLIRQLSSLDEGLLSLKETLGDSWKDTLVAITTEFGRTVKVNGTQGTDHGTGGVMFLLGGALGANNEITNPTLPAPLRPGQVHGRWPGLAQEQLFQARDLMPTSDVRYWLSKALGAHWQLNEQQLHAIFPDILP